MNTVTWCKNWGGAGGVSLHLLTMMVGVVNSLGVMKVDSRRTCATAIVGFSYFFNQRPSVEKFPKIK
jgi:hypothetical protein